VIPLLSDFFYAFFFDERAARRWLRGGLLAFAGTGLGFADQLGAALGSAGIAKWVRVAAIVSGFVAGAMQSSAAKKKAAP
jgi:hypothetical protein